MHFYKHVENDSFEYPSVCGIGKDRKSNTLVICFSKAEADGMTEKEFIRDKKRCINSFLKAGYTIKTEDECTEPFLTIIKESKNNVDIVIFNCPDEKKNTDLSMTYYGKAIEALGKAKTIGEIDPLSRILKIDGVNIFANNSVDKIGVGTAKIFWYAATAFTKLNHQNTPSDKLKLRVFLDMKDYAQANGGDITSDTARRNFRRKIRNYLENLRQSGATFTERVKGKETRYAGINYIGKYDVKGDSIMIEFTLTMAEYLVSLPLLPYPRSLYSVDDHDTNAFAIAQAMCRRYGINNNVMCGTENLIKVETLLNCTSFPTLEKLQAHKWSWARYVKVPFEQCLDRLYQIGFIKDYCYCFAGGQELTYDEAAAIIDKDYGYFVSLLVKFELNDYEDHTTRAKAIAENRAERMKKLTEAKKRKKSDKK